MENLAIGEQVYHRSNANVVMIIIAIDGDNITCRWIEEDKKNKRNEVRNETFIEAELTKNYDEAAGAITF